MLTVPKALSRGYCATGQNGRFSGTSCQDPAPRNKDNIPSPAKENTLGNASTEKLRSGICARCV